MFRKKGTKVNFEQTKEQAVSAAIHILAYSDNTQKMLKTKLTERGYTEENAEEAVRFVVEKGYLQEERFFPRFVEYCATVRMLGRGRITQEAKRKGFAEETFENCAKDVFDSLNFDELCLKTCLKLKYEDEKKMAAALLRKGYSMGNIHYAIEEMRRRK